jgi:hypothetical protein
LLARVVAGKAGADVKDAQLYVDVPVSSSNSSFPNK